MTPRWRSHVITNFVDSAGKGEFQDDSKPLNKFGSSCLINDIRGWAENLIGWLWCNGRIWPNVVGFFNIVSPAVHILLPSVVQHLDSCGIESLILILKKVLNCRYDLIIESDTASQRSVFSCWLTENRCAKIRRIWRVIKPVQSHSHAQQQLQPQTCVQGGIILVKQDSLCQFFRPSWNVSCITFQSPELLYMQCGFIWKETMQLVLGKVEFNVCQVLLLWHNSFLASLWTFQPTLVCLLPLLSSLNVVSHNKRTIIFLYCDSPFVKIM